MRRFETPEDQDVIITLDYQNSRQIAYGCKMPELFYNLYIIAGNKLVMPAKAINKQIAHSMLKFKAKKGTKYIILVANWKDTTVESNFNLSSYAEKATAEITK